jgi:hypothetical protein
LCGDDRALCHVKAAGAAHQIGHDNWKNRPVDTRADAIQQLHADQPIGIVREWIETTAKGQD